MNREIGTNMISISNDKSTLNTKGISDKCSEVNALGLVSVAKDSQNPCNSGRKGGKRNTVAVKATKKGASKKKLALSDKDLRRREEVELFQSLDTAKQNIMRCIHRFGSVVYQGYVQKAQSLIDGSENFDSIVVTEKGQKKENYMEGFKTLLAQIEATYEEAREAYRKMAKGNHAGDFQEKAGQLIELYGRLQFRDSVVEGFIKRIDDEMAQVAKLDRKIKASGGTSKELGLRKDYELRLWMTHDEMTATHQELKHWVRESNRIKGELIEKNEGLVKSIAEKYKTPGIDFEDLIQEGNIGLMRATEKFEYSRGCLFSTCATPWIRQGITRAIENKAGMIRIPVHMFEKINKMKKVQEILVQELKREATPEEIAEELNWDVRNVREMLKMSSLEPISLDEPVGDSEGALFGDIIEDKNAENPAEKANFYFIRKELEKAMGTLSNIERQVIEQLYGFLDGFSKALKEVGQLLNVSSERIRQIATKALAKLRNLPIMSELRDSLDLSGN
jgi:RNA polymerase primary sigma factor